jgi:LacI family transcriptional regulator
VAYPKKREKIKGTVKEWLEGGRFAPGDRFPSDQELAQRFKVTHVTVRAALKGFVEAGWLERRIGQGTVVRAAPQRPGAGGKQDEGLAGSVAVAIPDTTHSFFAEVLRGVETALFPARHPLVMGHTWELPEREEALIASWRAQGVRRLLLVPAGDRAEPYRTLVNEGIRLVLIDRSVAGLDVPVVASRDRVGVRQLVRLLVDLGHRKIVHLAGPPTASTARERQAAFVAALSEAGIKKGVVVPTGFFLEDGYRVTKALLDRGEIPDAIFGANDPVAVGAMRALAERQLEVPGDVSLAGYGDTDLARNFALTSVRQFPDRMGVEAVRLLLSDEPSHAAASIALEPELVARQSTARADAGAGDRGRKRRSPG